MKPEGTTSQPPKTREEKIAAMQALIEEGRAGGISPSTVTEILQRAREEARKRGLLPHEDK